MNPRTRLERELTLVLGQLRRMDIGAKPPAVVQTTAATVVFDDADLVQADQRRDIGLLTRERLVERAERLHEALDRVEDGSYGACVECGEAIHAARLKALPEAETCVRCQDQRVAVPRRRVA